MVRYETARRDVRLQLIEDRSEAGSRQVRANRSRKRSARGNACRRYDNLILAGAALIAFAGLAWTSLSSLKSSPDLANRSFSTVSVTVAPGDTLWSLAQRYEDPALRPAERVDLIRQANPDLSAALVPGQTLLVPVTAGSADTDIHLARLPR